MNRQDLDLLFEKLARDDFRAKFDLGEKDLLYLHDKGLRTILQQGHELLSKRLAPARPVKDGRQTPWRGHPVFVAQHATGTCCRGCLSKWHGIPKGKELSDDDMKYVLSVLERWLSQYVQC